MNLETKITIYKFTPQLFTLTQYILELFQTSPKEAFRLLFDAYHMKLCIYAVQLTDSFEMAEDIVQDFFIYFWEKKYYLKIFLTILKIYT